MIRQRLMAIAAGSALAAGGTAVAAHSALAGDNGDTRPPTAASPAPATPQQVTRAIPGVGTVMFTVDPATGAITNVIVTPLAGVTTGTPVVANGSITIPVTLANGTQQTLKLKIDDENGVVKVETEVEHAAENEAADNEAAEPPDMEAAEAPDPGDAAEHAPETTPPTTAGQEDGGDHHDGPPASVAPTAPSGDDHSGDSHSGDNNQGDGGSGGGGSGGGHD